MSISLDKFRAKLVIKILYARSAREAERYVHAAITSMEKAKVSGQIITAFVERVISQLRNFQSAEAPQINWSSIIAATPSLKGI